MVVMRSVFNNNAAKQIGMQGSKDITGKELLDLAVEANIAPELNYATLGVTHSLKGVATINGANCYQVELVMPSGKKKSEFFDAKSNLKVRSLETQDSPQGPMTVTIDYSNYKEIKGIQIPFELSQSAGPMQLVFKVDKVLLNEGTTEEDFKL